MTERVTIEPRTTMVLVQAKKLDEKRGHILVPKSALVREQHAVTEGTVIAIGPDAWSEYPNDVGAQVGDYVAYAPYSGFYVTDAITREEFLLINDVDIKATLRSE